MTSSVNEPYTFNCGWGKSESVFLDKKDGNLVSTQNHYIESSNRLGGRFKKIVVTSSLESTNQNGDVIYAEYIG